LVGQWNLFVMLVAATKGNRMISFVQYEQWTKRAYFLDCQWNSIVYIGCIPRGEILIAFQKYWMSTQKEV